MNTYVCKGTGSNMYCDDLEASIHSCPNGETKCASLIWSTVYYSMTCKNGNIYTRPKCPYYYQNRYDNININIRYIYLILFDNVYKDLYKNCFNIKINLFN